MDWHAGEQRANRPGDTLINGERLSTGQTNSRWKLKTQRWIIARTDGRTNRQTDLSLGGGDGRAAGVDLLIDGGQEVLGDAQGVLKEGEVRVVLGCVFQQVLHTQTHTPCTHTHTHTHIEHLVAASYSNVIIRHLLHVDQYQ